MSEHLIREYYRFFNERRFEDAAGLLAPDALVDNIPFGRQNHGPDGYCRFATAWNTAFPDGTFRVERIDRRGETLFDVHLLSEGTHQGTLDVEGLQFKPTGARATFQLRELLDIRDGSIVSSTLSLSLNELIQQLSFVNYDELTARLERIRQLTDDLLRASGDDRRDVANRLGPELDAARRALRPHYNKR
jgi:predicted ester cyclase